MSRLGTGMAGSWVAQGALLTSWEYPGMALDLVTSSGRERPGMEILLLLLLVSRAAGESWRGMEVLLLLWWEGSGVEV